MARKNRLFAKLASDVDTSGNLAASGIQSEALDIGVTVYATRANLPTSGNTAGDQAYVTGNNRLYIWNGSGWYNIALLNVAPSIQSVLDSGGGTTPFSLAIDGTATTITITAADSDGDPITYSATSDSDFSGLATISQVDNVFTITPFSSDSATTSSGTITFTATDGVNIASSGVQTFKLNFLSALWDETALSIGTSSTNGLANNIYIDRSQNEDGLVSRYGTGDTQSAFHPYLDNWSSEFSGNEWIQTVSTNSAFDFSAGGDFTIEMWVKDNLTTDAVRTIMNMKSGSYGFLLRRHSSNRWELYYYGSNRTYLNITDYGSLTDWYHMAITVQNGQLRWFVNGQQGFTTSSIAQSSYNFTTLDLGSYASGNWNGYISNVRVVKGTALYTSNFTPPTEKLTAVSGTTFLAHQSNRFIDNGGNNEPITISAGTLKVSAFNPFGQESEYAPGENKGSVQFTTSDGISLAIRPSGTTTTYTIEFWYKWDSTSTINANHYLLDARGTPGGETGGALLLYRTSATTYNDTASVGLTDDNLNDGTWHYLAVCNDGTNLTYWLDGSRIKTSATTRTIGTHLWLNSRQTDQYHNASNYADFRVSSTARYASTDTTITVPTSPIGYDDNTTAYYPFDNAGIYDKTGNNTLTLVGNTATSTTQTKFADTAMYFDGSGDGIDFGDQSILKFLHDQTCNYTIEGWIYPTNITGRRAILMTGAASASSGALLELNGSSIEYTIYRGVSGSFTNTLGGTAVINQWQHVAVTVQGTSIRTFLDGTLINTSTWSLAPSTANTQVSPSIARDNAASTVGDFFGYIENFQILKGVAKYTANFTPPTLTQGRQYQAES